jgi:hypothetical protein
VGRAGPRAGARAGAGRRRPARLRAHRQPAQPRGPHEPIYSAHHLDFGACGSDPRARTGSSTGDLHVGTTKWSRQIPGYAGFLPAANTNPTAVEHGYAADVRPPNSDNRDNVNQNMPGYTGHAAKAAINDYGPKCVNVVTTQGYDQEAVFRAAALMKK